VGSSSSSSLGSLTSARAKLKRRFMPPDSSLMFESALDLSAAKSSKRGILALICASLIPK
jgi:hypothetical protein